MGAWGYGIRQDDFVCDVIGDFEDHLKAGKSVAEATAATKVKHAAAMEDSLEGPLFWIALAEMQWTYGGLEPSVLQRVKDDFDSGRSLLPWEEEQRGLTRRRAALEKFIAKVGAAKARPKKPPTVVVRAPKFRPGDCLSIHLPTGQYTAAIVLAADHSTQEYGKNLVAALDYLSADKPTMEVFRRRKWLILTRHDRQKGIDVAWYMPIGFRQAKNRLEVVGQVEVLETDPTDSNIFCGWATIGEQATHRHDRDATPRDEG